MMIYTGCRISHPFRTDKEHWFVLSWYFSPISTDPAVVGPIVLPLTDKVEHYMVTTKGEGRANCSLTVVADENRKFLLQVNKPNLK